ncbi:MAG: sigma 54-interacting transcriptional regulator [Myxococcales bacterium]|nr:sigma 54-interacting transcriptional regulator [Myxococcales bacterium]
MSEAHLSIVEPTARPRIAAVEALPCTIGSSAHADVQLADPDVAEVHAEIQRCELGLRLVRHASPLWVNGRRVREHVLAVGDLVTIGRSALSLRLGAPPASYPDGSSDALEVCRRLYQFARRLGSDSSLDPLMDQLLADVVMLTGASRGTLVLLEGDDPVLARVRSRHKQRGEFSGDEEQLSRTAIAAVFDQRRPLLWQDAQADSRLALAPSVVGARLRSLMCAPIVHGDATLGALYVSASEQVGAFDQHALDLLTLYSALAAQLLTSADRQQRLRHEVAQLTSKLDAIAEQPRRLVGSSQQMQTLMKRGSKAARSGIAVLLLGETGSGKGMLARELHRASTRSDGPFVSVHCGAIPSQLLESELFGHVRGAFTGASQERPGRIRSADGGTLFLDEIGEMPLEQQTKLLKVLEDNEVRPVGGEQSYRVDFRLVCATNRDLEQAVKDGTFRGDLYYRVAGLPLELPPLRERGDDAVELAQFFVKRDRAELENPAARLSAESLGAIRGHDWPGNVRELETAVRRAIVLADGETIEPSDLGIAAPAVPPQRVGDVPGAATDGEIEPLTRARDQFIARYIRQAVERNGGNRSAAAKALGVSARTVYKYLEEF